MRLLTRLVPPFLRPSLKRAEAELRNSFVRRVKLRKSLETFCHSKVFEQPRAHVFFGYFDISPFSPDGRSLLAHRVPLNADPKVDAAEIVVFFADQSEVCVLGKTDLWCWQMGARLRWLGDEKICYNVSYQGNYGARITNAVTGAEENHYEIALYDIHPGGGYGLSLDFSRLQRLRPGYGYARLPDTTRNDLCPANSGITVVDMSNGDAKLLISIAEIASIDPQPSMAGAEHYLNHISYSPSGERFAVFHLWHGKDGKRRVRLLWFDNKLGVVGYISGQDHISHMAWLNDGTILAYARMPGDKTPSYQVINLNDAQWRQVFTDKLREDGHPAVRPGASNVFVCDTYPDRNSFRSLYLGSLATEKIDLIGKFHSPPALSGERRCDLHPRFSPDGRFVAIDSAHLGRRSVVVLDLESQ